MRLRLRRRGFTLIEVILALTIALLLLGALYVAVNMQLASAQVSRDTIQGSTLERAIMSRMDADAAQVMGLSDPARYRFQAGLDTVPTTSPAAGGSTSGGSTSGASSAGTTTATSASSATSTTASSTTDMTSANGLPDSPSSFGSSSAVTDSQGATNIVLPFGVMGDNQSLHLFVSNLPREIYASGYNIANSDDSDAPPPSSDIRRISYWLVGDGDSPGGLARQEVPLATSDDALQNLPPGIDSENSYIIADEVRSLNFQYWDGTDWQDSWDSTVLGPDGVTPLGSPLAIAVTITIAPQHTSGPAPSDEPLRTIRHVLLIPSANGMTLQTAAATGTSTQTTTSSSTTNAGSTTNGGGASP